MKKSEYVGPNGTWISPEIFSDPALYELEKQRVFGRSWLVLGHLSQLPRPGSFLRTFMGEESVLVTRDRSGTIRAHLNLCRHRGYQLCQEDRGVTQRFQCRYHGWTYDSDGSLMRVPGEESIYYGEIDRTKWGLIPVPRIETYKGLIFGNFDRDACTLEAFLGDMAWYLDIILDRREGGTELLGPQRWRIRANWKVVAENHCGDEYHVGFAHGSMFPNLGDNRATPIPYAREIRPGLGHGLGANIYPDKMIPQEWLSVGLGAYPPHVYDYLLGIYDETMRRLGATARTFGPAGSFEQDDAGNWAAVTRSSYGTESRKHPLNLQMGAGHEARSERIPGELGLTASEINQRGFYLRWMQDMFGGAPL